MLLLADCFSVRRPGPSGRFRFLIGVLVAALRDSIVDTITGAGDLAAAPPYATVKTWALEHAVFAV